MFKKIKTLLCCSLCCFLLCGCGKTEAPEKNAKISVVTTIFPLYDFARAVGGDKIDLKMLIKPGSEVHSYDPLPSDMRAVYDCDLFLYIGGESDTWVQTMISNSNTNGSKPIFLPLINSVNTICENDEHEHRNGEQNHSDSEHNHDDEHIWTSTDNAILMVDKICEQLCEIDFENAEFYKSSAKAYTEKIKDASKEILNTVSEFENPFMLVADRFPFVYFAQQYKIGYEAAFDGCAVSTDISLKTMARLTDVIKDKKIKVVFCTELSNKNIAKALSEEIGVKITELHSAHNVTLDDFKSGITYVDILYRNINALKRGLV